MKFYQPLLFARFVSLHFWLGFDAGPLLVAFLLDLFLEGDAVLRAAVDFTWKEKNITIMQ